MYQELKLSKLFICFSLLFPLFLSRTVSSESVKFILASEKKPETLFLFPGRVSLLSLPCPITKAIAGSPNDIKTEIDKFNPNEAHILLRKWRSEPSNLILKCQDKVFVFNLIPTRKSHYDYVKVLSHIKTALPLKVKSPLLNTPTPFTGGLKEGWNFTIRKVLDSSWEDKK